MAKRKKKVSATVQAYRKERKRVQSFLRRAEKRDFIVPDNVLPPIPKRITKASVNRLKKLNPDTLYVKLEYVLRETGEIVSGKRGRYLSRSEAANRKKLDKKIEPVREQPAKIEYVPSFEKIVLSNFQIQLDHFQSRGGDILRKWLDRMISDHGESDVAEMLNNAAKEGVILTYRVVYDKDSLMGYLAEMMNYLPETFSEGFYVDEILEDMEEMWYDYD